jgi:ligand-binding sensor domain-containing protein
MDRVFGAFAFDGDRLWMGDHDLWSYRHLDRVKLRRERPDQTGRYVDITFDGKGRPWVIRNYRTILRRTRNGWEEMQPSTLEQSTTMYALEAHPDGGIWIGTGAGLFRWKRGEWTHRPGPADGLPEAYAMDAWAPSSSTAITSLAVAPDGSVWAAGGTGVARFDDGVFTRWGHRDGIWPWHRLAVDPVTGDVYGVGRRHIGRFDGSRWEVSGVPEEGAGRNSVHAIVRDGALLVLMETGRFLRFVPADLDERRAAVSGPRWRRRARAMARRGIQHLGMFDSWHRASRRRFLVLPAVPRSSGLGVPGRRGMPPGECSPQSAPRSRS